MQSTEIEEIEEKIYEEYNQDGAAECLMGGGLILAGFSMAAHTSSTVIGIVPVLMVLLGRAWKKRITFPRLGYVEFSSKRRMMKRRGILLLLIAALAGTALAVWASNMNLFGSSASWGTQSRLFFGGMISVIIVMVGIIRKTPHFYWVAIVNFIFIFSSYWWNFSGGYALIMTDCRS
jgi:sterol desaturase/sphingolipid hydroxylase (fatty acid hydroxylase superfamily)